MLRAIVLVRVLSLLACLAIALAGQTSPPAPSTPADQKCTLEGKVTNSLTSELVKKATVHLFKNEKDRYFGPGSNAQGFTATSQSDGTFRFEGLEPGEYRLSGERSGYVNTFYGSKGGLGSGTTLVFQAAQHMADITLALIPQAVVSGKVLDDEGDPVGQINVQLLSRSWMRGKERYFPAGGQGNANDQGEFRISNVSPGKYYLVAKKNGQMMAGAEEAATPGKPDIRPVTTYYPAALDRQGAAPIEVKAGQELTGMDIRMRTSPTFHVRGKITGSLPESGLEHTNLYISQEDDSMGFSFGPSSNIAKDGSFNLPGVAPGSYVLMVVSMSGTFRMLARQPVVVENADVKDVVVSLVPQPTIKGQIRVEGKPPANAPAPNLQSVQVALLGQDMVMFGGFGSPKADGTFSLENQSPGKYSLMVTRPPEGTYLKSARFGQQDVLGKEIDLTSGAGGELDLVFSYGVGEVSGTLQLPEPDPAAGPADPTAKKTAAAPTAMLILVPEPPRPDGSGPEYATPDQNGAFVFKSVSPGRYHAYALETGNSLTLSNPQVLDALSGKGTDVEVKENDKKQIQLKTVPADDFRQILARLGIDQQ